MASHPFALAALWIETFFEILFNAAHVHWDILAQDLRHTARGLARVPGFALTAITVTALGIGATTAVFSVTDHALIRPLPFADSERIVKLYESSPTYARRELSPPNYRDWHRMSTSFEAMGAFASAFEALGIRPLLGRPFTPDDDREGAAPIVILSYGLWRTDFGGDPEVVGKTVRLDDTQSTVIGVMPPNFYFPNRNARLWRHLSVRHPLLADSNRNNNFLYAVAKLKPGVSLEQARAEMQSLASVMRTE